MNKREIAEIFEFLPKSKRKAREGTEAGAYPFYTSSQTQSTYANEVDFEPPAIVLGSGGAPSLHLPERPFSTSGDCFVISPKRDNPISAAYVFRYLQANIRLLEAGFRGAGLKHLSKRYLSGLQVPMPSVDIQRKAVSILDAADALRTKRGESLELLDQLIQSVFLDMFGDPVTNPKGWDIGRLSDLGTIARGKSQHRPRNDPALLDGPHPLIQTGEVRQSFWYIREFTQTYSELGLKQSKKWPAGTLCITIAANIAETGILAFDACFPDSVVGFVPRDAESTHYVQGVLGSLRAILDTRAPKVAQKNINLKILSELPIPLPPQDLQSEFASIIKSAFEHRYKLEQHLAELDTLFASLQSRAFRGESSEP